MGAETIARLNDEFRRSGAGGRIVKTQGIAALPAADQQSIFAKVRLFDAFSTANDPYGEHDFGSFEHNGGKVCFKIDYYDPDLEHGSENPADPDQTVRVLTVMLAHEY